MKKGNLKALAVSLTISLGTGVIGGFITYKNMGQYEQLYKPPLSPPSWLFPIVWTILFFLMGVASYLVYISKSEEKEGALKLYGLQLIANTVWTIIFFAFKSYLLAFVCLLLLWYLIYSTYKSFNKINKTAGILFIPYLIWVTFAGYLNFAISIHYLF